MQFFHIACPEILPDSHSGTDRETVKEKHHHVGDHGGRTDGGERLLAHKVAHDDRINRVVEHLEDITEHERERKEHQLPENRAYCHVPRCSSFLFLKYHSFCGSFLFSARLYTTK